MKITQLLDDAAEKFEVAQLDSFANLAKQAQLRAKFAQLQVNTQQIISIN